MGKAHFVGWLGSWKKGATSQGGWAASNIRTSKETNLSLEPSKRNVTLWSLDFGPMKPLSGFWPAKHEDNKFVFFCVAKFVTNFDNKQ